MGAKLDILVDRVKEVAALVVAACDVARQERGPEVHNLSEIMVRRQAWTAIRRDPLGYVWAQPTPEGMQALVDTGMSVLADVEDRIARARKARERYAAINALPLRIRSAASAGVITMDQALEIGAGKLTLEQALAARGNLHLLTQKPR